MPIPAVPGGVFMGFGILFLSIGALNDGRASRIRREFEGERALSVVRLAW